MKSQVVVSVAQMKVLSAKKNLPKILSYIDKASRINSDIICFPECSFNPNFKKPSVENDLKQVQMKCKEKDIFAVINGYFKVKNGTVYNRTYLINNKGKILGFYNKIYLWTTELNNVKRGNSIKVIKTPLGKIGFCVCWDLFFPEMFRKLKKEGAEIILCPSYWLDNLKKEAAFLEYVPTVLAYQYMQFFVYCNAFLRGGTSISQIAAPWGKLKEIRHKEGIITTKFYYQRLKRFQNHFKKVFFGRDI